MQEWVPVGRVDIGRSRPDDDQYHAQVDEHHGRVELGALLDPDHQDHGDEQGDQNGGEVEPGHRLRAILERHELGHELLTLEVIVPGREQESGIKPDMEHILKQRIEVARPAVGREARPDRVFQDQVPADDPGDQLAQRGVGVGVRTAGHRNHAGQLRIAKRREPATQRGQQERDHDRGAGDITRHDAR